MYDQYRGRCIGRLLRFLWEYDKRADELVFHSDIHGPSITLYGKPYANYTWDGDTDVPTFKFLGEDRLFRSRIQKDKKAGIVKLDRVRK